MGRRLKVYLPSWTRWMVTAILGLVWGIITYVALFTAQGREEMGWVGWGLASALILAVGAMVWAMASGKLPAYIVEEEDDEQ